MGSLRGSAIGEPVGEDRRDPADRQVGEHRVLVWHHRTRERPEAEPGQRRGPIVLEQPRLAAPHSRLEEEVGSFVDFQSITARPVHATDRSKVAYVHFDPDLLSRLTYRRSRTRLAGLDVAGDRRPVAVHVTGAPSQHQQHLVPFLDRPPEDQVRRWHHLKSVDHKGDSRVSTVFVAGAVCPHPPLIVPEVAQGAAPELEELRIACRTAIKTIVAAGPDQIVCIASEPVLGRVVRYGADAGGTLRRYGVGVSSGGPHEGLGLGLTIGAWLLDEAGWQGGRAYVGLPGVGAFVAGRELAAGSAAVGVLAMGDGSAKRTEKAPGSFEERAAAFDADVVRALSRADLKWFATHPDPGLAAELWCTGGPAWQALAGAATQVPADARIVADIGYDAAPYGVGYVVSAWSLAYPPD
jgi:hypothetical protein